MSETRPFQQEAQRDKFPRPPLDFLPGLHEISGIDQITRQPGPLTGPVQFENEINVVFPLPGNAQVYGCQGQLPPLSGS